MQGFIPRLANRYVVHRQRWATVGMLILFLLPGCMVGCGQISDSDATGAASQTADAAGVLPATKTAVPTKTIAPSLSPSLSPTPECLELYGRIDEGIYKSTLLRVDVPYLVYLPPCYPEVGRQYPTLYLLHGFPFDELHWGELGFIERVETAISEGLLPKLLLVMPRAPEPLFTSSDGGPGSYEVEFLQDLLPLIEAAYDVDPRPQRRALAGISRGGVWALEITFRNAAVFDSVAALSPALNVNYARPPYDPVKLAGGEEPLPSAIFLSAGAGEPSFRQGTEALISALEQNDVKHTYVFTQGGHDAEGWIAVFDALVEFLSVIWQTGS